MNIKDNTYKSINDSIIEGVQNVIVTPGKVPQHVLNYHREQKLKEELEMERNFMTAIESAIKSGATNDQILLAIKTIRNIGNPSNPQNSQNLK